MPSKQVHIDKVSTQTVLYHYTKSSGVNGILNNNCFWATKSDFLNDPNEFSYIREIIDEVLHELIKKKSWVFMFLNDILEESIIATGGNREFFVLSFSCCRDSITLWSEFGNKTGYNIGFSNQEIVRRIEKENTIEYHGFVIYDKEQQKRLIKRLLSVDIPESLHSNLIEILERGAKDSEDPLYVKACRKFQKVTAIYAMFFKYSAFAEEQEYRFVFKRKKEHPVHFREKDGFFIPYIEINLDGNKLPVEEIVVAPQNHIDLAQNGMDYMLQYKGYDVPVTLSNIKLRY